MARMVEESGFDGIGIVDTQNLAADPYSELCLAAHATKHLKLRTAVTNPVTRHPAVTASAIATVQAESGGRAILGIGRGDSAVAKIGERAPSSKDFARYISQVQGFLRGEEVTLDNGYRSRNEWIARGNSAEGAGRRRRHRASRDRGRRYAGGLGDLCSRRRHGSARMGSRPRSTGSREGRTGSLDSQARRISKRGSESRCCPRSCDGARDRRGNRPFLRDVARLGSRDAPRRSRGGAESWRDVRYVAAYARQTLATRNSSTTRSSIASLSPDLPLIA